ncbi:MAG: hypothetical protein JNL50_00725 [Phycisphaerae bacterium]|nr:hypothetical protein [Phycisphaerae bacterium]
MPRRWIRIAASAMIFTALGALTTTAVAWGIALSRTWERTARELMATAHSQPRGEAGDIPLYCDGIAYWPAEHSFGITTLSASKGDIANPNGNSASFDVGDRYSRVLAFPLVFIAERPPDSRHAPRAPATRSSERRYGWPARAFWYLAEKEGGHVVKSRSHEGLFIFEPGGVHKARDDAFYGTQPLGPEFAFWLPIYILPLGFTLNTLFYAAAWFIPLFGIRAARRTLRRRRGLCTRCAYDLKGLAPASPCPECGLLRA